MITTIAVIMLGTQVRTIVKNVDKIHDVEYIQALQLEIGTYSEVGSSGKEIFQDIADRARLRGLSIFGIEPFRKKREMLATIINISQCRKVVYRVSDQADDPFRREFKTIKVLLSEKMQKEKILYVTNEENTVIGFGLPIKDKKQTANLALKNYNFIPDEHTFLYTCR